MPNEKMTKKQKYEILRSLIDNYCSAASDYDLAIEFIDHEIELNDRKRSSSKPTKEQVYAESLMLVIRDVLDHPMRVSEIAELPDVHDCVDADGKAPSANRINAILKKMIVNGEVERTEVKKVAYFNLVD